jgi:hypothetical protein
VVQEQLTYSEIADRYNASITSDENDIFGHIESEIADLMEVPYEVKTDGSLRPYNAGEVGLEVISPPQSFDETKSDYIKMITFMEENGIYTNSSCGLHINISLPNYNFDDLDLTKLIIFLGDKYILDAFDRSTSSYAVSSFDKFMKVLDRNSSDGINALETLRSNLNTKAGQILQNNETKKYSSVNVHRNRVEFRAPGGNWRDKDPEFIFATIARMIFALHIALDDTLYQKQYASRLYKLIGSKVNNSNAVNMFAKYASGEIEEYELRRYLEVRRSWR